MFVFQVYVTCFKQESNIIHDSSAYMFLCRTVLILTDMLELYLNIHKVLCCWLIPYFNDVHEETVRNCIRTFTRWLSYSSSCVIYIYTHTFTHLFNCKMCYKSVCVFVCHPYWNDQPLVLMIHILLQTSVLRNTYAPCQAPY